MSTDTPFQTEVLPTPVSASVNGKTIFSRNNAQPCSNCNGELQVEQQQQTFQRRSCIECVEKHLGAAMVLCSEIQDGYSYRLMVIGHLHEAGEESREWEELHNAIREARKAYQSNNIMPNWEHLSELISIVSTQITQIY
ncbi:MAG: hypothetical protein LBQ66_04335 [Planctomycetaceae bacterium]|nr:hypothetical protein [Planctomycetaceae bacterium]